MNILAKRFACLPLLAWTLAHTGMLAGPVEDAAALTPFERQRLAEEVNWTLWKDVFEGKIQSEKPLLLFASRESNSLGRAMARDSFSRKETADLINEGFLPVALDCEQHPIGFRRLQSYLWWAESLSGPPLTIFATPNGIPFAGGSYFPASDDWGNQGFPNAMKGALQQWDRDKRIVEQTAAEAMEELDYEYGARSSPFVDSIKELAHDYVEQLLLDFDFETGSFSNGPQTLEFDRIRLLDFVAKGVGERSKEAGQARDLALKSMIAGGAHDVIRGGFFVGSIDAAWKLPEFRKSARLQAEAILYFNGDERFGWLVQECAQTLLSDFRLENGLFSGFVVPSFQGHDSSESKNFAWRYDDLKECLSVEDLAVLESYLDIGEQGNLNEELDPAGELSGYNVLRFRGMLSEEPNEELSRVLGQLKTSRKSLESIRKESLASLGSNALVSAALINAGFEEESYSLMDTILERFYEPGGRRLYASYFEGRPGSGAASSVDYALLIRALLDMWEISGKEEYLLKAQSFQGDMDARFASTKGPYFIGSEEDCSDWKTRIYDVLEHDGYSANSIAIQNLDTLSRNFPEEGYDRKLKGLARGIPESIGFYPDRFPDLILALSALEEGSLRK